MQPVKKLANSFPVKVWLLWLVSLGLLFYFVTAFSDTSPNLVQLLYKWDGGWYHQIVTQGYQFKFGQQSNVAFFPLYPALLVAIQSLGMPASMAILLLSAVAFGLSLYVTYRLAQTVLTEQLSRVAILLLSFFPFSFFFLIGYTESLFLLLVSTTLLLVARKQWWLAALTAGLASGTRIVGILLFIVIGGSFIQAIGSRNLRKPRVLAKFLGLGAISASGLITYMAYLQFRFGDALAFVHAQQYWPGRNLGIGGLKDIAKHLLSFHPFSNPYALNLTEVACLIVFAALAIYCFARINRWWGLFSLAALLVPLISGTTISLNRYVIVLVPCFIAAAHLLKSRDRTYAVLLPSAMLLAFFFSLFYSTLIFIG